jgi:hypothetical protein
MREGVLSLRERGPSSARGPFARFVARHVPTWRLAAAAALMLGGVGAFDTGEAAPWTLFSYWTILTFTGGALGAAGLEWIDVRGGLGGRPGPKLALLLLAITAVMTPLVFVLAGLALGGSWSWERVPQLWTQVLLLSTCLLALQMAIATRAAPLASAMPPSPASPPLLAHLPARLRGARIEAVEAEDHYLRVHTDRGAAMILMRLCDAVAELEGLQGSRTHRSWWVARAAVAEAARGRGRAVLTLKCGVTVPVSRTYAPMLRRDGWY